MTGTRKNHREGRGARAGGQLQTGPSGSWAQMPRRLTPGRETREEGGAVQAGRPAQTGGMEATASQDPASVQAGEGQEAGARPVHAHPGTGPR